MAIGITYKSSGYTTTAGNQTSSPAWTPQAQSLLVAFVTTTGAATWTTDPSAVSGHGVSYSKLTLGTSTLGTTHKLSIWVGKAGASPTNTGCLLTAAGTTTGSTITEFEITGHDNSGTALAAIVASTATNNGTGTSATVNLAAAADARNRAMTFVVQQSNAAPSASGAWTLTAGAAGNYNTPATGAAVLFKTSAFDTAGAATTANVAWRMVGIEIKTDPTVEGSLAKTSGADTSAATGTSTVTGTVAKTAGNDTSAATGDAGSGGGISFTDTFTGTNGDAPNVRWTGDQAGWEINTNHLRFIGSSYSFITAACTPGDNTIDVDVDFSAANFTFAFFGVSEVDASNYSYVQLDGSEELSIRYVVAGVETIVTPDTGHTRLNNGSGAHLNITLVGTLITVTVTGGGDPGQFSGNVSAATIGGNKVGLGINTGKTGDWFDNYQLTSNAASGTSGTLAVTSTADTSAATGTSTVPGSLAKTTANDTSAAAGTSTITGSLAKTAGSDTSAATGSPRVAGSLAKTNADDTSAATGSPVSSGTLAKTSANDTSAATGSPVSSGTLAKAGGNDTSAAAGSSTVTGSAAPTSADDTAEAEGDAEQGSEVTGSADATGADDTSAATGSSTVTGSLAATNADDTAVAEGDAEQGGVSGSANALEAPDTVQAAGSSEVYGSASPTSGNDTSSATGDAEQGVVDLPITYVGGGTAIRQPRRKRYEDDEEEPASAVSEPPPAADSSREAPLSAVSDRIRAIKPKAKLKTTDKAVIEAAKRIQIAVEQAEEDEDEIVMRLIAEML
jgi:hypothetical protein